jgi:hypothetical protein
MKRHLRSGLAVVLGLVMPVSAAWAAPKEGAPLVPARKSIKKDGYTIDTVGDKKQDPASDTIRIILRVSGEEKKPIEPEDILLVSKDGKVIKPEDRDDHEAGGEDVGLPMTVTPSVTSTGSTGVGVGLDLGSMFGGGGPYAYTKVDFKRTDFVAGAKLKIAMPGKEEFLLPLTSIGKKPE